MMEILTILPNHALERTSMNREQAAFPCRVHISQ